MEDVLTAMPSSSIPAHVPPELVVEYPLTVSRKTKENPFDRIIPEIAAGPIAFYAPAAVSTGDAAGGIRRNPNGVGEGKGGARSCNHGDRRSIKKKKQQH